MTAGTMTCVLLPPPALPDELLDVDALAVVDQSAVGSKSGAWVLSSPLSLVTLSAQRKRKGGRTHVWRL